jgi:hypothetical protein
VSSRGSVGESAQAARTSAKRIADQLIRDRMGTRAEEEKEAGWVANGLKWLRGNNIQSCPRAQVPQWSGAAEADIAGS